MPRNDDGNSADRHGSDLPASSEVTDDLLLVRALRTIAGRGGILGLSFLFAVALARALPPAERGDFALIQALNGFAAVALNLAIGGSIVYHVGKEYITVGRAASAAISLAILCGVAGAVVFIPPTLVVREDILPGISIPLILMSLALVTPVLMREYLGGVMVSAGRSLDYVAVTAAQPFGSLICLLLVLLAGRTSLGSVTATWAAGIVLSALVAIVMVRRLSPDKTGVDLRDLRTLSSFGVRTYPAFLVRFLNLRIDQFLVRLLASAQALGQYAVAVNVGELLIRIPNNILWALSGAISASDRDRSADLVAQFCRWSLLIVFVPALVIAMSSSLVIPLIFGEEYEPAVGPLLLLLPGLLLYAPASIILDYFVVQRGEPRRAALISGCSVVSNILLNIPLISSFGARGASIASSLAYSLMFAIALWLFCRTTRRGPTEVMVISTRDLRSLWIGLRSAIHPSSESQ